MERRGIGNSLERHTDAQVVDFWHAAEYLGKAAAMIYRGQPPTCQTWMDESCHKLKHEAGGAAGNLEAVEVVVKGAPWAKEDEDVQRAITYFGNQSKAGRMD